jgi:alpha-mannosidase
MHRGTYTSQAKNKRFNRQAEFLLRETEILSALALVTRGHAYPAAALQKLWKLVLTNQFHDILPGSSIGEVYADSTKDYATVLEQTGELHAAAFQKLQSQETLESAGEKVFAFNSLGFPRTEVVTLEQGLGLVSAPALGYAVQTPAGTDETVSVRETEAGFVLENTLLKAVFNRQGGLTSLVHKPAQRESIEPGQAGNTLVLYEDLPNRWDAWDMDVFHLEKPLPLAGAVSAKVVETSPLRASLAFEYTLSDQSTLWQTVSLDAPAARLDFACEVDWHEKHKFLKVEFPLNVRAPFATYEIQFGHVQRPTHFNTPYDLARFEVPAHKWADLSEPDFGVALLNDCKYGYAAHGNVLRLSLLRAPTYPDPEADQGRHAFRFAVYPHTGSPQSAGVTEEASRFNVPLLTGKTTGADLQQSFFAVDHPAVLLDTLKKAEDSDALVLRLYEARGTRGRVRLTSPLPVRSAALVNLLEDELAPLNWEAGGVEFEFKPFEILSLRITL